MIATIATSNHPCAGPIRLRYRRTMAPTSADGTSPRLRTNASDVARTSTVTMPATAASTTRAVVMVDHTATSVTESYHQRSRSTPASELAPRNSR